MFFDQIINTFGVAVGLIIIAFMCMLAVLWLLLPLYIFQIRNRLDILIVISRNIKDQAKLANERNKARDDSEALDKF